MSRNGKIIALDVGTDACKILVSEVLSVNPPVVSVLGCGVSQSKGLRKGVVVNVEATIESISEAAREAEQSSGVKINSACISVSGNHIEGTPSVGVSSIRSREVQQGDLERVIESARAVAIPQDREVLHVLPQDFIIDGQDGIKEPLGISGVRLESKVYLITGAIASSKNLIKCANRAGINISDIIYSGLASAQAVLLNEERELGCCLIDIGAGTADIVVFRRGTVVHASVLPVAGNHITNDIATGLRTPIACAEAIKKTEGHCVITKVREDELVDVPSAGNKNFKAVARRDLVNIIAPRVSEIFHLIKEHLEHAGVSKYLSSGIILTGGSASIPGIADLAESVFKMPARVAKPLHVQGKNDLVNNFQSATCLGLAQYALVARNQLKLINHQTGMPGFFRRAGNWLSEHF